MKVINSVTINSNEKKQKIEDFATTKFRIGDNIFVKLAFGTTFSGKVVGMYSKWPIIKTSGKDKHKKYLCFYRGIISCIAKVNNEHLSMRERELSRTISFNLEEVNCYLSTNKKQLSKIQNKRVIKR